MERIPPEILLNFFDLVVRTPDNLDSAFLQRTPVRGFKNKAYFAPEDVRRFSFEIDDHYPSFRIGITAHTLSTDSPLRLSHVCKEWRDIAFADSSLWCTIYVTNGRPGFLQLFKLWLSNSGSCLLTVVLRDCSTAYSSDSDGIVIADIFALAASHHRRLASLKVRAREFTIPLAKLSQAISPTMEMTNLRSLAFSFNDTFTPDLSDRFNEVWGRLVRNSPQLEEMQMWNTMDYDPAFLRTIPFHRLVVITLPKVVIQAGSSFVTSLAQCTHLQTLSISLSGCSLQPAPPYAIAIPSLTELCVVGTVTYLSVVENFLEIFHLPSLTTFSIHDHAEFPATAATDGPWGSVKRALDHWKPKLQSLSLRYRTAPAFERYFLPLLDHPALKSLSYLRVGGTVGSTFMDAIAVDAHQPDSSRLSNLQSLHVESAYFGVDDGLAVRLALSRTKGFSERLRSLQIDFLSEEEMNFEKARWDACADTSLAHVDWRFRWIGVGRRQLEREFMVRDFSLVQAKAGIVHCLFAMERMLPEILLHIFDLVVHTPDDSGSTFFSRPPIRNLKNEPIFAPADAQAFSFEIDDLHPNFTIGITAHALSTDSPLRLSHVSKEWRVIAFADSSLWSTIYITNGRPGFLPLFKLWLINSGSRLLKLVFRDCSTSHPSASDGTVVADMFALAALHHPRLSSIKIRARNIAIPLAKLSHAIPLTMEFTHLKTLAFSFMDPVRVGYWDRFNEVWGRLVRNSPQLEEMQIWDPINHHDLAFLRAIPFHHLTAITLPGMVIKRGNSFVACLAQCHHLRTLSVSLYGCSIQSQKQGIITLPSLTELCVVGVVTHLSVVKSFLEMFHFPSLTTLSIHDHAELPATGEEGPMGSLKRALDHWRPKLQSLSLRYRTAPVFERYFLPLLHHPALESLSHLRVGGLVGSTFMLALTVDTHQPKSSRLPNLQSLHIESAYFGLGESLAVKLALSRTKGFSERLRWLKVDFLSEEEMNLEKAAWEACTDTSFIRVDRQFRWTGVGPRLLAREFMVRDFSLVQA